MRGAGATACLVALVLLAPVALAGTEARPEVDDEPDESDRSVDMLAAWLEPHPEGVRLTIKLAALRTPTPDRFYYLAYTANGARAIAGVVTGPAGEARGHASSFAAPERAGAPETFETRGVEADIAYGAPAYVRALVPYAAMPGVAPGSVLIDLVAGTDRYDREEHAWAGGIDVRGTAATYTVQRALVEHPVAWALGLTAAALISIGLILGRHFGRDRPRTPRKAAPPAPQPPPPIHLDPYGGE